MWLFLHKICELVRIVENNDWVIYSILAILVIYLLMSRVVNKGISLWHYLGSSREERSNISLNWVVIALSFIFIFSVFISQYIPIVPKFVKENLAINGYSLNKLGFTFCTLLLFYFGKCIFSYFFFKCTLSIANWKFYIFQVNKFFVLLIILFSALSIMVYFFPINRLIAFDYFLILFGFLIIGKNAYLIFNKNPTFPHEWYYKILYLCTLQILPYLVIGKFLFF